VNPGEQPCIGTVEGAGIEQQRDQHDIHRQKSADPEPYQQPCGVPLLALAVLDLIGDAAAIAAESASLAIDGALHRTEPERQ
jgi:hypothetical protein